MVDLTTSYMGIDLKHPIVPSASPLSKDVGTIKAMEDAGAAAVVMHSVFEEQIETEADALEYFMEQGTESFAEALSYFPPMAAYRVGPDVYLEHIRRAKESVDIPILGSLNGISPGGWTDYAREIEQAGADGIELNVYFMATGAELFALDVETVYLDILKEVKRSVTIPVAMKLSPYFTALTNFAERLDADGADALVLFNRFYQPDIDLEALRSHTQPTAQLPLRVAPAIALDRDSVRSGGCVFGADQWRSFLGRRDQVGHGGGRRGPRLLGAV